MVQPPGAADDATLLLRVEAFLAAPKIFAVRPQWKSFGDKLEFSVALDIEGVTEPGFRLGGRAQRDLLEQDVTLHLSHGPLGPKGRFQNFERLDWRPRAPHTNTQPHPDQTLVWLHLPGSHRHALSDNAAHPSGLRHAMVDNLPFARPFPQDPQDWSGFAQLVSMLWNVKELGDVEGPPWQDRLAPLGGRAP
ncbi:hypothetical protein [Sabulicella glaciei]|uniref:Uncharacterized protein n=1 Tax=Sabulicella glaciei TaxID=2984948 RepID=A0ABT3P0T9_9PROT|nr:hypothetical protein [Roseococcus sp. MDT2-1-1]MCW8088032.1 hypothetical protein [Roseococcus sp. MDT2-1-1]